VSVLNILKNKYGMLVIGLIALAAGLFMFTRNDVTCGGAVMQAGDTCEHTKAGITTSTNSFETEKANQHRGGMILSVIGGALTLGGAGWIVVSLVRRRPEESAEASPAVAA
jgi:hypothetical protein